MQSTRTKILFITPKPWLKALSDAKSVANNPNKTGIDPDPEGQSQRLTPKTGLFRYRCVSHAIFDYLIPNIFFRRYIFHTILR